jgi:two-component system sensor histidine kinase ChvG
MAGGGPPHGRGGVLRRTGRWLWRQLVRIRTRLLLINLVAVLVPVVGIGWARTYERESLRALERDMQHVAELSRTILEHNLDDAGRPRFELARRALRDIARRTRMRIRLLDRRGAVVADSHRKGAPEGPEPSVSTWFGADKPAKRLHPPERPSTDPGPLQNRVEIRAALKGQLGTATRIHERIGRVFLFLAMPVMVERRVQGVVYITRSTTPVLLSLHHLRRNLIQVLGVALGVTVLMTLFLATTISRPLSRLTRLATRIARGDRTQVSLRTRRQDEIGQLSQAFEAMVQQLDARARYISQFAANISHEFKTPLSSIRGAAELLSDGALDDPKARDRFLGNILGDVERLDRLVSRILELSRIESEASLESRGIVALDDVARRVVDQLGEVHPVRLSVDEEDLRVEGNRSHLESALRALVENAVQHSPEGVAVEVSLRRAGASALVVVSDRGPGISEANRSRIFDRFFTTRGDRGGTGLGLAMVASVVKSHGGEVSVSSAPGEGSRFELRLPRVSTATGPASPGG